MRRRTRAGLRGVGLLAATSALCGLAVAPSSAAEPSASWQPDLSRGEGTGVVVQDGTARFDPATAHGAPLEGPDPDTESSADPTGVVPTGLLTLPSRRLDRPTSEVTSTLVTDAPAGSTAGIDVRGRRADGGWTEWVPATPAAEQGKASTELPAAVREVQGRIVLTATGGAQPTVREVTLSAAPTSEAEGTPMTEAAPRSYSVFATREGLVGGTTSNGHKIANRDRFVALPSRRALSPNGKSDYSVKVCAPNGRCAFAPVWDIGPWNTKDDYWNPPNERQTFKDLPQGVPQAQAAYRDGHNGGKDQFGRKPANPAGIDLGDGIFWDALGLKDNSQVQVDYLWTGSVRLSAVSTEGTDDDQAPVHTAPDSGSPVVGVAADSAQVPVECRAGSGEQSWLRVGDGQYLESDVVRSAPADLPACGPQTPAAGAGDTAGDAAGGTTGDRPADGGAAGGAGDVAGSPAPKAPASGSPTQKARAQDSSAQKAQGSPARQEQGSPAPEDSPAAAASPAGTARDRPAAAAAAAAPAESGTRQAAPGTGAATRSQSSATPAPPIAPTAGSR